MTGQCISGSTNSSSNIAKSHCKNRLVVLSDILETYTCTVENDRGESSETVVVPGETWTLTTWHRHTAVFNPLDTIGIFIHLTFMYFQWAWMTSSYACVTFKALPPGEAKPNDTLGYKCNTCLVVKSLGHTFPLTLLSRKSKKGWYWFGYERRSNNGDFV